MTPPGKHAPRRIAVLGCSGSGKSTLAAELATRLALPYVPTDSVFWTANWQPVPMHELRGWLTEATSVAAWVTDGNFDDLRDVLWARADLIVWLDLPLSLTLWRVAKRNLTWWITRKTVWSGQRMTLAKMWSGVRHAARTHALKRRTYPAMLAEFPNIAVLRMRSRRELADWLSTAISH